MSAVDLARYKLGATDKFRGTGVYCGIQFERDSIKKADALVEDEPMTSLSTPTGEAQETASSDQMNQGDDASHSK
eukprot:CAMPEP_0172458064 /NCGR_PEP_ID=MMETSP1065-20121228/25654_1 /TAXON_ID=265537 /ORGANISM="Amphiprora paludosa, Strain CCMP125" /LENGTH=74 /DNA_ID=CAMNT_0013212133 /DNA_START=166 /DNA_END=390 /DNA_ORIENTATION=+